MHAQHPSINFPIDSAETAEEIITQRRANRQTYNQQGVTRRIFHRLTELICSARKKEEEREGKRKVEWRREEKRGEYSREEKREE